MINIYCDESCHLEHDGAKAMIMGAISCPQEEKSRVYDEIRKIKQRHGLSSWSEIKWTGVSQSKIQMYMDLIDFFVNEKSLSFRAVIAKNKENLNHDRFNEGSHDLWYYKTYYYLLDAIVSYNDEYKILIDIKDTRGGPKVDKLREVLCNNMYDFKRDVIKGIYQIQSHESDIIQLTDLLIGAIGFFHNGHYSSPSGSSAKKAVVDKLFLYYKNQIVYGTARGANKMDIFLWKLVK